ncbi:hypothetical protein [Gimesia fumaroli]|uniref:Phage virion morphogenesis family protein n=1 Tax=Gimesia fumaroli TaxID=2527976 RepID=A0A518IKT4_9PLAN|nr:hypothetical protein [Gimesia fumaroli]QDV53701.1 hypothetical protein Enr17x_57820 [Gimesia fumaroli]
MRVGYSVKGLEFSSESVIKEVRKAGRKIAYKAGGLIRMISKRKLRKARQKRVSELTDEEKQIYEKKKKRAKRLGQPRPKRPLKPSDPFEPPRLRDVKSALKYLLFFAVGKDNDVVIGPQRAKSGIAGVLEHGGTSNGKHIEPRPFMGPSLEEAKPKLDDYWQNSVTR